MDANITTMIAIKKNKKSNSSYLFEDPILGWAGNENSKKRFKSIHDYGRFKVPLSGQIKRSIKIKKIRIGSSKR